MWNRAGIEATLVGKMLMGFSRGTVPDYYRWLLATWRFVRSAEFRAAINGVSLPVDRPGLEIGVYATTEQLSQIFERIRDSWTRLGTDRPHYSVLTCDEFRPQTIDGSVDRFWASGDLEVTIIEAVLQRCGFGAPAGRTYIEYGCGLGRVTIPLAARFGVVHAYDISPTHLSLARKRAAERGVSNIDFHCCSSGVPAALPECDFFYSRLVFQHNPPPVIRELIRMALQSLRIGGIAAFGVPTYLPGYRFLVEDYLASPRKLGMELHCIPQSEVFALIADAGCALIEVCEERPVNPADGRTSNLFIARRPLPHS